MFDQEKVNETIHYLIKNFDQYMDNFNTRLKINLIFKEFEEKAHGDLKNLVKLSNLRYKGVKSGNSLQSVLSKQKPIYNQIINKVLNDEFYQSNDIHSEKMKFMKMNNMDKNSQINILRNRIKENAKTLDDESGNLYEAEGEHKYANMMFLNKLKQVRSTVGQMIHDEGLTKNTSNLSSNRLNTKKKRKNSIGSAHDSDIQGSDLEQADRSLEHGKMCKN
jgi:hypothetical protein